MNWYALTVRRPHEFDVEEEIQRDAGLALELRIEQVYCPVETFVRKGFRKRKDVVVSVPLIPGYVFVRCVDPYAVAADLARKGATGVLRRLGTGEPGVIGAKNILDLQVIERDLARNPAGARQRKNRQVRLRTKRFRAEAETISVGDTISVPSLGYAAPNAAVVDVQGQYLVVEQEWFGQKREVKVRVEHAEPV